MLDEYIAQSQRRTHYKFSLHLLTVQNKNLTEAKMKSFKQRLHFLRHLALHSRSLQNLFWNLIRSRVLVNLLFFKSRFYHIQLFVFCFPMESISFQFFEPVIDVEESLVEMGVTRNASRALKYSRPTPNFFPELFTYVSFVASSLFAVVFLERSPFRSAKSETRRWYSCRLCCWSQCRCCVMRLFSTSASYCLLSKNFIS